MTKLHSLNDWFDNLKEWLACSRPRAAAAVALMGSALAYAPMAQAAELRLALGLPDTSPFYAPLDRFAKKLTAGGVPAKVYTMSLLTLAEVSNGVRDGLADGGLVLMPYNPSEYSEGNLAANLSMLSTSGTPTALPGAVMSGVIMEYVMLNCPACLTQMRQQNQVFLGSSTAPAYDLLCRGGKEVKKLEDFAGKRLRSGSANYSRIAEYFGATPMTMPAAEIYDGMDKGVLDCVMIASSELITLRLIEVTKTVLRGYPGGVFAGSTFPSFNISSWKALSLDQRKMALRAVAELAADGVYNFENGNVTAIDAGKKRNIQFLETDGPTKAKIGEFLKQDVQTVARQSTETYKLKDVDAKIAKIIQLVDKWKGLVNAPGMTQAKLSQIYWDQVLSKIDPATYGLN
jgi:TRAP-type transport system periplasmic protein